MAIKSLFPEEMFESMGSSLTLESIASKLTYFHEELHLLHWQAKSYAEHQALGGLYEYVHNIKDEIIEKIMGYSGKVPQAYKIEQLTGGAVSTYIVSSLMDFAKRLEEYAETNKMPDICNIAQSLSGEAAKTKFLLTLT